MINRPVILNVLGVLLITLGGFMLCTIPVSLYYGSGDLQAMIYSSVISALIGLLLWLGSKNCVKKIAKREGFLIVATGWITISVFSSLPYLFSGVFDHFLDALFESVSGLTTTGATIISDIESVPEAVLLWRSMTQWLGGMGIIVLTVALFPLLGIGGVELFVAESPGPTSNKIHPRIKETAKRFWFIYLGLTLVLGLILKFSGMGYYDAINHALTTMSTGGFSTKNASIAYFQNPWIHYWIILFMFIAGTNYTLIYYSLKGKFIEVWKSDEFRTYLLFSLFMACLVAFIVFNHSESGLERSIRDASFQVVSIITTTGYVSADYTSWSPVLVLVFFLLLFIGASAGSTSGGIKIIRHLVLFKNTFLELKRLLHPKAIIRIKIDGQIVQPRILTHILVFLLLYLMLFVFGSLIMIYLLRDFPNPFMSAVGATASALGNVGPAIGDLGPLDNFSLVSGPGKFVLIILMILGRLELFTILILFTGYFWKKN